MIEFLIVVDSIDICLPLCILQFLGIGQYHYIIAVCVICYHEHHEHDCNLNPWFQNKEAYSASSKTGKKIRGAFDGPMIIKITSQLRQLRLTKFSSLWPVFDLPKPNNLGGKSLENYFVHDHDSYPKHGYKFELSFSFSLSCYMWTRGIVNSNNDIWLWI